MTKSDALWTLHHAADYILSTSTVDVHAMNSFAMDDASFRAWRLLKIREDEVANETEDAQREVSR